MSELVIKNLPWISAFLLVVSLVLIFAVIDAETALKSLGVITFFYVVADRLKQESGGKSIAREFMQKWESISNLVHLGLIILCSGFYLYICGFFIRNYHVELKIKSKNNL